jgi:hypothetical protein
LDYADHKKQCSKILFSKNMKTQSNREQIWIAHIPIFLEFAADEDIWVRVLIFDLKS